MVIFKTKAIYCRETVSLFGSKKWVKCKVGGSSGWTEKHILMSESWNKTLRFFFSFLLLVYFGQSNPFQSMVHVSLVRQHVCGLISSEMKLLPACRCVQGFLFLAPTTLYMRSEKATTQTCRLSCRVKLFAKSSADVKFPTQGKRKSVT